MKEIVSDAELVAYCGLYCGACKRYLKGGCPGCHETEKAKWCRIRVCCMDNQYASCADCKEFQNPDDCKKFNNLIARIFAIVFRSNRTACIEQIRELGIEGHANKMTEHRRMSIKR